MGTQTYASQANLWWTNNKIPCSFYTFETKMNNVWSLAIGKKNIISADKR